jgi:hypothetical protein
VDHAATHPLGQVIHVPLHLPVPVIIHIQLLPPLLLKSVLGIRIRMFFGLPVRIQ